MTVTVIFRAKSQEGSFVTNPGVTNGRPKAAGVEGISRMDAIGRNN